jgi:hypothetical protein
VFTVSRGGGIANARAGGKVTVAVDNRRAAFEQCTIIVTMMGKARARRAEPAADDHSSAAAVANDL